MKRLRSGTLLLVRLTFPAGMADEYAHVRDELIEAVVGWAGKQGRRCDELPLYATLDFRLEVDGQLGLWRPQDIRLALLDWFPRKVTMMESERLAVVPALHTLVDYLAAEGLLATGSADPAELHRVL